MFFFSVFFLGIYLWLFSSNRCSSETSVRIRQLWKYLWAEKCKVGSSTKQWHGPHPSEVSRLLLNNKHYGNWSGGRESCCLYCYKNNILLNIIFIWLLLVCFFFLTVHLNYSWSINNFFQETKLAAMLKMGYLEILMSKGLIWEGYCCTSFFPLAFRLYAKF